MSVDIGPKIGIDGEAEFRQALTNINQQLKTLGSEMGAVPSAFDANDNSQDKLAATTEVVKKQVHAQAEKLAMLKKGLEESAEKYGENDTKTLKWKQSVNEATAKLNDMQAELRKDNDTLQGPGETLTDTEEMLDKTGDAAKEAGGTFNAFGEV